MNETLEVACSRCGLLVQARLRGSIRGELTEEHVSELPDLELEFTSIRYELALCGKCSGLLVVERVDCFNPADHSNRVTRSVVFPAERRPISAAVPEAIARAYDEAARAFSAGLFDASAVMCRKALEALCAELKAEGPDLYKKLSHLAMTKTLDQRLLDWAHQLRAVGNDAAHELKSRTEPGDARDALEFLEALLQNAYVLPARLQAFRERRASESGTAPEAH